MKKVECENEQEIWKTQVVCEGFQRDSRNMPCGQTWEVTEDDIVVKEVLVMYESVVEIFGMKCPDCGTFTEIHCSKIPQYIQNRCLAKYKKEQEELKQKRKAEKRAWFKRLFGLCRA